MTPRKVTQRGNAALETALVFLPMMFMFLSSFEIARALWTYHTLTSAVKSGARYAMVRGAGCIQASTSCQAAVSDIASVVRTYGIGLEAGDLQLTLTDGDSSYGCGALSACLNDKTQWPSPKGNAAGSVITIQGQYAFHSVLPVFWPGQTMPALNYVASASEVIEF